MMDSATPKPEKETELYTFPGDPESNSTKPVEVRPYIVTASAVVVKPRATATAARAGFRVFFMARVSGLGGGGCRIAPSHPRPTGQRRCLDAQIQKVFDLLLFMHPRQRHCPLCKNRGAQFSK